MTSSRGPETGAARERPTAAHPLDVQFLQGPVHQLVFSANNRLILGAVSTWGRRWLVRLPLPYGLLQICPHLSIPDRQVHKDGHLDVMAE